MITSEEGRAEIGQQFEEASQCVGLKSEGCVCEIPAVTLSQGLSGLHCGNPICYTEERGHCGCLIKGI